MLSQKVLASFAVIALLVAPSYSFADVLWDQQPDTTLVSAVDQQFGDFPDFSTYLVNDATFNTDVNIDSVTTYFTNGNAGAWLAVSQGVLNIFNGDALVDADNPASGGDFGPGLISVTVTDLGNNLLAITASGLSIDLSAGTYWFGLTPEAGFATLGQEFHYDSGSTMGFNTQYRNPGGGFGLPAGISWGDANDLSPGYGDASMTITGTQAVIPEPSAVGILAIGVVGLVTRRRR